MWTGGSGSNRSQTASCVCCNDNWPLWKADELKQAWEDWRKTCPQPEWDGILPAQVNDTNGSCLESENTAGNVEFDDIENSGKDVAGNVELDGVENSGKVVSGSVKLDGVENSGKDVSGNIELDGVENSGKDVTGNVELDGAAVETANMEA